MPGSVRRTQLIPRATLDKPSETSFDPAGKGRGSQHTSECGTHAEMISEAKEQRELLTRGLKSPTAAQARSEARQHPESVTQLREFVSTQSRELGAAARDGSRSSGGAATLDEVRSDGVKATERGRSARTRKQRTDQLRSAGCFGIQHGTDRAGAQDANAPLSVPGGFTTLPTTADAGQQQASGQMEQPESKRPGTVEEHTQVRRHSREAGTCQNHGHARKQAHVQTVALGGRFGVNCCFPRSQGPGAHITVQKHRTWAPVSLLLETCLLRVLQNTVK